MGASWLAQLRCWCPRPRTVRRTFLVALAMNTVIVATGGAVRLTASGLGCPTFPRCTDASLILTRELGLHGLVEFTNRMLTFVLSAAVGVALVVAWRARRPDLRRLATWLLLGIFAQALLGGVTVLTGLNPVTVMAHFLLSMVLIAVAVVAHERASEPGVPTSNSAGDTGSDVRREVVLTGRALLVVCAATLFLGTVVTGTGPHSGDRTASHRLPLDLVEVTQAHADLVFLLVGLTIGLLVALRVSDSGADRVRRGVVLLTAVLAQGAIGYTQYATDLPVVLVGAHVLGACLVWIAAWRLVLALETAHRHDPALVTEPGRAVAETLVR